MLSECLVRPLILIIEDEQILARAMSVYLERHVYATMVAHAGEDGLRLAADAKPDVAVVDVRLPDVDGLAVLDRLRIVSPRTEVIMATAHPSIGAAVLAMKRGAFDYLSKPVDLEDLRMVVLQALAHRA